MSSADAESPKAPPKQLTEREIDAPSRQTLIMLFVICVTTLVCWAAGRAACNYNVPGESLTPRKTSVQDRIQTSKGVGVELAQAISSGNFDVAKRLVDGEAREYVQKEQASCSDCPARRAASERILSVGRILKANAVDAIVEVETVGAPGGKVSRVFGVERNKRDYLVTRVYSSADEAELREAPEPNSAPPSIRRGPGEDDSAPPAPIGEEKP
jgi:hypothetical protein